MLASIVTLNRADAEALAGYLRDALDGGKMPVELIFGADTAKALLIPGLGSGADPLTVEFSAVERKAAAAVWEVYSETDPAVSNAQYEGVLAALGNGR